MVMANVCGQAGLTLRLSRFASRDMAVSATT